MNGLTGIPITFEAIFEIFEGVSSTVFSYIPMFIGITIILVGIRVIPMLFNKFTS